MPNGLSFMFNLILCTVQINNLLFRSHKNTNKSSLSQHIYNGITNGDYGKSYKSQQEIIK